MTGRSWRRIKALLSRALDFSTGSRQDFLEGITGENEQLIREVQELLAAHEQASSTLDGPIEIDAIDELPLQDLAGRRIGSYRLQGLLGAGGMGVVYLASRDDGVVHHRAAVKLVSPSSVAPDAIDRFLRERQILARIDHPNIAYFIDAGTTEDGFPYFVMEYVHGIPITTYCDDARLSIPERIELFLQVCSAVAFAHGRHGVLHRDIKPANILVSEDGVAKLVDFGIAHVLDSDGKSQRAPAAHHGSALTPLYASPEQLAGARLTDSSDVYSLGVVLYELLTGHHPINIPRPTSASVLHSLVHRRPLPPSKMIHVIENADAAALQRTTLTPSRICRLRCGTPDQIAAELAGPLEKIVLKAIRVNPRKRYQTVAHFMEDLRSYLAWRTPATPKWGYFRYSRAWASYRGAILTALLVAGSGSLGWQLADLARDTDPRLRLGRLVSITDPELLASEAALAPSGDRVAYVTGIHGTTRLQVQEMPSGSPIALAADLPGAHSHPAWHPAGSELAFEVAVAGITKLYRVSATGGAASPVDAVPAGAGDPAWSPSGRRLAYVRDDGLYAFDLGTATEERVVNMPFVSGPVWSPSGRSIAFAASDEDPELVRATGVTVKSSIWRVDLETRQLQQLTDRAARHESPMWLPGEERLLFLSDVSGSNDLYEIDAGRSAFEPAPTMRRHTVGLQARHMSIDQRGSLLAFSVRDELREVVVARVPEQGETTFDSVQRVSVAASSGIGVAVSADGTHVFYDEYLSGNRQIIKRSILDGTSRSLLTSGTGDVLPVLSPDPGWLLFLSTRSGSLELHGADIRGRSIVQLTDNGKLLACYDGNPATPCRGEGPLSELGAWLASARCEDGEPGVFPLTRALARDHSATAWIAGGKVHLQRGETNPQPLELEDREPLSLAFGDAGLLFIAAANPERLLEIWRLRPGDDRASLIVAAVPSLHAHPTGLAVHGQQIFLRAESASENIRVIEIE